MSVDQRTTTPASGVEMPRSSAGAALRRLLLPLMLVVEVVVFASLSPQFLTASNLANVGYNAAEVALVAAGLTFVVLLGGIDVSTGFALGVVAWVVATLTSGGQPGLFVVGVAVLLGCCLGALNGTLVTMGRVPPIIATLGMSAVYQTTLFALWSSSDVFSGPVVPALTGQRVLGIPAVLLVVAAVYLLLYAVQTRRPFGRSVYAIGSNPEAARLAGVRSRSVVFACYVGLGALVGLAACVFVGRVGVVQASSGSEVTLAALAAVVVGGTSILGGEGGVARTLGGLLFIAVLQNGVVLAGVPPLWNGVLVGAAILLAVGVDVVTSRSERRASGRRVL